MAAAPFSHVNTGEAPEIAAKIQLGDEAKRLLADGMSSADFVERLRAQGLRDDATHFLAMALPKRRAVWWACLVAVEIMDQESPKPIRDALAAAESWVYKPTEDNRRKAQAKAEAIEYGHPAAWAAMAAFFAEGSLAPPGIADVKPADHLTASAVVAVMRMRVAQEPVVAADLYDGFLARGIDIANGGDGRPEARQDASQ